ncbi:MAG: hypothetical protein QME94_08440 [Anaerolineae bacterium]|nr:hypothetical protein [Anaerolineae bacterium]
MRGKGPSAPARVVAGAIGLICVLSLACIVPSLSMRGRSTLAPTETPRPTPTQSAAAQNVTRISEEELNRQLQGKRPNLGEGVECEELRVRVRKSGITVLATVRLAQFAGAAVPVQVQVMPSVRDERLHLEVLDVSLGGPYAAMGSLIKPLLSAGLAQGLDSETALVAAGKRIAAIELEDGYMVVTTRPGS